MGKKGFSATTFVLVAVLIGALFIVSKSVTPPPAAPPEPPKEPTAAAPKGKDEQDDAMTARMKHMKEMRSHIPKGVNNPDLAQKPKFDPNTIEVSPEYFHHF